MEPMPSDLKGWDKVKWLIWPPKKVEAVEEPVVVMSEKKQEKKEKEEEEEVDVLP